MIYKRFQPVGLDLFIVRLSLDHFGRQIVERAAHRRTSEVKRYKIFSSIVKMLCVFADGWNSTYARGASSYFALDRVAVKTIRLTLKRAHVPTIQSQRSSDHL